MTHISEITLLIAVIALALWPVVLFALRFLRERQKRLEYIERMTKDEQDEVTTKDLVISVLKKIGCQPKVNEENHITFKYQGDDFYIAAEEENRFIMIWNPWWGSINADNEALPYLKEIINLANVNSLVTTVYMAARHSKHPGIRSVLPETRSKPQALTVREKRSPAMICLRSSPSPLMEKRLKTAGIPASLSRKDWNRKSTFPWKRSAAMEEEALHPLPVY